MAEHVQCGECFEVKEKKEVRDNGNQCPDCGGKEFRPT